MSQIRTCAICALLLVLLHRRWHTKAVQHCRRQATSQL